MGFPRGGERNRTSHFFHSFFGPGKRAGISTPFLIRPFQERGRLVAEARFLTAASLV
jgi:hypothetical protein